MVFLFRDKAITNIFFLLVLIIAVHFHFFISPATVTIASNEGFIGILLKKYIQPLPSAVIFNFYIAIVFLQAIRLNTALNNLKMFHQQHYTVAMSYILFSGFFIQWTSITSALIANFLIIWIYLKLTNLNNHTSPKNTLFNVGLLCGITILAYHPTVSLIAIAFFALAIVRPFRIAEWFILLMGILLPFYLLTAYLYLTDQLQLLVQFLPHLQMHLPIDKLNSIAWIGIAVLIITVVLGIYHNQENSGRMVIHLRKNWGVMFVLLLLMVPIPFIFKSASLDSAVLSLVPLSAFAANFYSYPKRLLLPNLLFWLSVAFLAYNNWLLVKN